MNFEGWTWAGCMTGAVWNTYISWMNKRKDAQLQAKNASP